MSNKPQYRLLEFGLSKKPWYRILIVNFYTELENYIMELYKKNLKERIIEVTLNPLLLGFHNKSLDSELGLMFRLMNRFSLFFTLLYLTLSCFLNLSFGFLVF
ncbi:hypothetical protein ACJX0J_002387 [Zea mays]